MKPFLSFLMTWIVSVMLALVLVWVVMQVRVWP